MPHEVSCGAVLYTLQGNTPHYLLVETNSGHISFPKGHVEGDETREETARREILEETGLHIHAFLPGFVEKYSYHSRRGNSKDVYYFLADYGTQTIALQECEILRHWVLPLEEALHLLNREREREILLSAHAYLENMHGSFA